jgi:hypothetical protein
MRSVPLKDGPLFVSIDLDFFYSEDYTPADIPPVFNALFDFSMDFAGRGHPVFWAVCLSRPWLPDDAYAWELLAQSLAWFLTRPEFAPPEITIFSAYRFDQSRRAESFRMTGVEPPNFYRKENEAPAHVKKLLDEIRK